MEKTVPTVVPARPPNSEGERKSSNFHPSLWVCMKGRAEVLREEVRTIMKGLMEVQKILDIIMAIQRLGLDMYYVNEINELLHFVYSSDYNDKDLNLVSLRFYLLRKNGYNISSGIFLSFKDNEGNFIVDDTRSLLSLYNAANLRVHGEKVLDEAASFTISRLEGVLESSDSILSTEVSFALEAPIFRRARIVEMRNYIPIYQIEATRNETILEFAKVNFNLLQLLYCEELNKITLWDESAIGLLPEYIRGFYAYLLKTFDSFDEELGPERRYRLKRLVQAYTKELKWRDEDYTPKTLEEHFEVSMRSSGGFTLAAASFVGMDDIATKDIFEWILSYPSLFKSFDIFMRLSNDIVSNKREQTGDHYASTIQCYMKEHGTTIHETYQRLRELIEDSWKDMVEHCTNPIDDQPLIVPQIVVNFARTVTTMYTHGDAFTSSHTIKEMISSIYVVPIKV
uniref:Terpene synthase N-terminal domain-containing protein n=1 Tax=Oryza punctata TaxID=4537 RepID=A0A0E0JI01_ORYPU